MVFSSYEADPYSSAGGTAKGSSSDVLYTMLCSATCMALVGVAGLFDGNNLGTLTMFVAVLYASRHPMSQSTLHGYPPGGFPLYCLPYAMLIFTVLTQGLVMPQLLGLALGNTYCYTLRTLHGTKFSRHYFTTPHVLCDAMGNVPTETPRFHGRYNVTGEKSLFSHCYEWIAWGLQWTFSSESHDREEAEAAEAERKARRALNLRGRGPKVPEAQRQSICSGLNVWLCAWCKWLCAWCKCTDRHEAAQNEGESGTNTGHWREKRLRRRSTSITPGQQC